MSADKLLHDFKNLAIKFEILSEEVKLKDFEENTDVYQDILALLKQASDYAQKLS